MRRVAQIGVLAATILALSVPAASAGSNESIKTKGGVITFKHRDEEITAEDTRRDGLGVQAVLAWTDRSGNNQTKWVIDATGDDEFSKFKDLSIREGTTVHLTMCYVNKWGPTQCSRTQSAKA
jgi:uncharacterized protein involved in outer membrane biogenesis